MHILILSTREFVLFGIDIVVLGSKIHSKHKVYLHFTCCILDTLPLLIHITYSKSDFSSTLNINENALIINMLVEVFY